MQRCRQREIDLDKVRPDWLVFVYDGLNRRIVKDIDNSGDWDQEYNYYYGQRIVVFRGIPGTPYNGRRLSGIVS